MNESRSFFPSVSSWPAEQAPGRHRREQARVDTFLGSEGARRLRQRGRPVRVQLIDWQEKNSTSQDRDRAMAEALVTVAQRRS
jgi:hypothetical protein